MVLEIIFQLLTAFNKWHFSQGIISKIECNMKIWLKSLTHNTQAYKHVDQYQTDQIGSFSSRYSLNNNSDSSTETNTPTSYDDEILSTVKPSNLIYTVNIVHFRMGSKLFILSIEDIYEFLKRWISRIRTVIEWFGILLRLILENKLYVAPHRE